MLLGALLQADSIKIGLKARDKTEAICELADVLIGAGHIPAELRTHVIEAVHKREKAMSTGMDNGVALPHGSTERVPELIAAMGTSAKGVPFDSTDGEPARIIVLMVLARNNFKGYVSTLAGIANLLRNPELRKSLLEARSPEAALTVIQEAESELLPELDAAEAQR